MQDYKLLRLEAYFSYVFSSFVQEMTDKKKESMDFVENFEF